MGMTMQTIMEVHGIRIRTRDRDTLLSAVRSLRWRIQLQQGFHESRVVGIPVWKFENLEHQGVAKWWLRPLFFPESTPLRQVPIPYILIIIRPVKGVDPGTD